MFKGRKSSYQRTRPEQRRHVATKVSRGEPNARTPSQELLYDGIAASGTIRRPVLFCGNHDVVVWVKRLDNVPGAAARSCIWWPRRKAVKTEGLYRMFHV